MDDFSSFLVQGAFHEVHVSRGLYTLMRMRYSGRVWKKLDRMLFNDSRISAFPGGSITLLNRLTFDHSLLLLQVSFDQFIGP